MNLPKDFDKYVQIRNNVREQNLFLCTKLYEKIQQLKKEIDVLSPKHNKKDILEGIDETTNKLKNITDTIFPIDDDKWEILTKLKDIESSDIELHKRILNDLQQIFHILYNCFLEHPISKQQRFFSGNSIKDLLCAFDNENLDLRYPNKKDAPYNQKALLKSSSNKQNWDFRAKRELYHYYSASIDIITVMRNNQTHKNDAPSSTQFKLAQRKETDPISNISHPGNYITLAHLILLSIYEVVETIQIWIDTCVRIKLHSDPNFNKEQFLKDNI